MDENTHKYRWLPVVSLTLFMVPVAYPLSAGPVFALCDTLESLLLFDEVYEPLRHLPEPIVELIDRWAVYCHEAWQGVVC